MSQSTGEKLYQQLKRHTLYCEEMRDNGFAWDFERAWGLESEWTEKRDTAARQLIGLVHQLKDGSGRGWIESFGDAFHPGSLKDLGFLFFHWAGGFRLAPCRWTDEGKPSTDEHAVVNYLRMSDKPLVKAFCLKLLDYREAVKFLGTYIVGLKPQPNLRHKILYPKKNNYVYPLREDEENLLVHGHWKAHGAVSGRYSCTETPLQTTPAGLRYLYRAEPGMYLCETDYSQLEIRTIAIQADAKLMRSIYDREGDVYLDTARVMFNVPNLVRKTEQGEKLRQTTKQIALSSHYLGSAETAYKIMVKMAEIRALYPHLTVKQVKRLQIAYFKAHPEIPRWWKRVIAEAERYGAYIEEQSGRRVEFYGPADGSFATNFKNQSLAAHIMNDAFEKIVLKFRQRKRGEHAKTQVHDAVCSQGPDGNRLKLVHERYMVRDLTVEGRTIRLPVESKIGVNYSEVK